MGGVSFSIAILLLDDDDDDDDDNDDNDDNDDDDRCESRYSRRAVGLGIPYWTFDEISNLRIETIAETPSFIFIWCGCEEGLENGRLLLQKWGYRRCEDLCWLKTNRKQSLPATSVRTADSKQILHHTKEHCLMGIRGTVRRNQDGHLIHANVDTDIIISEEPPLGSKFVASVLFPPTHRISR